MTTWLAFFLVALVATSVFAVIDPDQDTIGVYFDQKADDNCLMIESNFPFFARVTVTNPSSPQIWGLEVGYRLSVPAGQRLSLTSAGPAGALPPGPGAAGGSRPT